MVAEANRLGQSRKGTQMTIRTYELSDEEYRTVLDALEHAQNNAVSSDAQIQFTQTLRELHAQFDKAPACRATEADRWPAANEDTTTDQ